MKRLLFLAAALLFLPLSALAQVPSANPPFNVDMGSTPSTLLFNDVDKAPGTYNSAAQANLDKVGAMCTFYTSAESGSVSVQLNLQFLDYASQQWTTLASTAAADGTAFKTPKTVVMVPAIQVTPLPTNISALVQLHLPFWWRLQEVIAGTSMTRTGTSSCNLLR